MINIYTIIFRKKFKTFLLLWTVFHYSLETTNAQEFSEGPYGLNYFDIAGPFSILDLNAPMAGDITQDNWIDIEDVMVTLGAELGTVEINEEQFYLADINNDGILDTVDLVSIVNLIYNPQNSDWNFQEEWNGQDSYIFIHFNPSASNATALWISNTKQELLENSPENVHYLFISDRPTSSSDIQGIKEEFDTILESFDSESQNHWRSHLHFIPTKTSELDNWLSEALSDKIALGIDRFQRLKPIGYLGDPNGFTGTHMSYLAHESIFYNYEWEALFDPDSNFYELTIFEKEHYTGGWAASISQVVEFPTNEELNDYSAMKVELLRGCPDAEGNYSDAGCDDYDRIAHMYLCDEDGSNCYEIARWITPFDRQPHHLTNITPFLSVIRPGGTKLIKFQESGWPNSLLTLKLRFYNTIDEPEESPQEFQPMWIGTVQFNPDYDENRPPLIFDVPESAVRVEFVTFITGHGWGSAGCFNCAEFCNSNHIFTVNGGTYEFDISYPEAGDNDYCMELETIAQGVIPNQYGTWGYGRAGWCPGMDVTPFITDITDYIELGDENIMDYEACRVTGNDCVTPPVCQGDGYCPEIALSSYIIIYY